MGRRIFLRIFLRIPWLLPLPAILSLAAGIAETHLPKSHGQLPLAFEDRGGSYVARGAGYSLTLTPSAAVLSLRRSAVTLRAFRANRRATMTGIDRLPGTANYFQGAADSRKSLALYSRVRARDIYPGIDLVFRGNQQSLEYDFDVAAGRDPGVISLAFEGTDDIRIDGRGDLILSAGGEEIRQPKAVAWQFAHGRKELVSVSYRLDSAGNVRFLIGPHDAHEALVIDPEVVFDNTFGGSGLTSAAAIALDPQGNIYVAGQTSSPDFPTVNALQSKNPGLGAAFVSKWSADGSQLLYSTYLGGSASAAAASLAVDSSGNAYVAGVTNSPNFPVTAGAFQKNLAGASTAFVAKLSPSGSQLIYSTFLGGGFAQTGGIAVDSGGYVVVTGGTQSSNFPLTPNAFQTAPVSGCTQGNLLPGTIPTAEVGFVTRLAPDGGSLVFSTLLGGTCGTVGQAVAVDSFGNAWVAGATGSPNFPVTADALQPQFGGLYVDGFLAQFNTEGALAYATYLGGSNYTSINGIALDGAGNIYLAGVTYGLSQPASPGAFQPGSTLACIELGIGFSSINNGAAFVAKLTPNAGLVTGLTYLGSGGCVSNAIVAVDSTGAVWVAGSLINAIVPFPTVNPFQINVGAGFVSKLSPDFTQLLFSTFFNPVNGIALDSSGLAYVAGVTPSIPQPPQTAYVAKIDPAPPALSLDQVAAAGIPPGNENGFVIAPGEVLRLIGKNLGPATAAPGIINSSGFVSTSVAGVQVNFGTVPAPLLFVSSGEIECVVPFELVRQSTTTVQVLSNGAQSNPVLLPVTGAAIQVLAVVNEDFTINSAMNPATPGSILEVYVAGAGQTVPPSLDGQVNRPPFAQAGTQIEVIYYVPPSGTAQNLFVTYAGAAPDEVSGVLQVDFVAPSQSSTLTIRAGTGVNMFSVSIQ